MTQGARSPQKPAPGAARGADMFRDFRPHQAMKTFLYTISFLTLAVSVLPWSIPVTVLTDEPAVDWIIGVGVHAVALVVAAWLLVWVPGYYRSIRYGMDEKWLYAEGGVLWRRRTRLPISRVQLVNITQGPWQRGYGVATVSVYTAATGQPTAELSYMNIANPEALRDRVIERAQMYRTDITGLEDGGPARRPEPAKVGPAAPRLQGADQKTADLAALLASLLDEVRSIRASLGKAGR